MKTLLHLLILALYIFPCFVCTASENCTELGGIVPVEVFNSPYTILPNGSLCCPEYIGNSCITNEKEIADKCRGRLVYEPCHFCKTCAKPLGKSCGGNQSEYGKCDEGLECIIQNVTTLEGLCYTKANRTEGEICGGEFGSKGRCLSGLKCNVSQEESEDIHGVCLDARTAPGACFKSCVNRAGGRVCGNNGHWYDNLCVLKRQNCLIPKNRQPHKIKRLKDNSTCVNACKTEDLEQEMDKKNLRVVSYSYGVVNASRATIVCKEGYTSVLEEALTLQCFYNGQDPAKWLRVVTKSNGEEVLRPNNISCFPETPENTSSSGGFLN